MSCFHPHKKHGETLQENVENERENLVFLRHCRGAGSIQVKDGKRGKNNGYGKNLLNMREKYGRKWIKKGGRPEDLLVGIKTYRNSVWSDIDWRMRRWQHWQNTVQDNPTGLQWSVHPGMVLSWERLTISSRSDTVTEMLGNVLDQMSSHYFCLCFLVHFLYLHW